MKKKTRFYETSAVLLDKMAKSFASAACFGHLYETQVPEELQKKVVKQL